MLKSQIEESRILEKIQQVLFYKSFLELEIKFNVPTQFSLNFYS